MYRLGRITSETNFISSGSKIMKRLQRRQYDPVIIEGTIGLVLGPFTALYRSFLKRCTLTNKMIWTIWQALSKPPQRRQGPDPLPLWLLVETPPTFGPELAYRLRVAQPSLKAFLVVSLHLPLCQRVRIISNRYLIISTSNVPDSLYLNIFSNKLIFCMRDTYYKWEPQTLESNHFSNTLVFNDL